MSPFDLSFLLGGPSRCRAAGVSTDGCCGGNYWVCDLEPSRLRIALRRGPRLRIGRVKRHSPRTSFRCSSCARGALVSSQTSWPAPDDQLHLVEVLSRGLVHMLGHVIDAQECRRLGPDQRGAFPISVDPGTDRQELLARIASWSSSRSEASVVLSRQHSRQSSVCQLKAKSVSYPSW